MISEAIKKQESVKKAYFKRNISNKPLILIQIPDKQIIDKKINTDEYYLTKVKKVLDNKKYLEGSNYAIWLSEEKTTRDKKELENLNSKYEILIFKQAIATGWDLPRANILVRLREPKTPKFDIQTLGRILRNPFFRYYNNQLIDNAFVFTKDEKYSIRILKEDFTTTDGSKKYFKRSVKSINTEMMINKIILEKEIDKKRLLREVANKLVDQIRDCFEFDGETMIMRYDENTVFRKHQFKTTDWDNKKVIDKMREGAQQKLPTSFEKKETLFTTYLKYKSIFSTNRFVSEISDLIAEELSPSIKKKDFFKLIFQTHGKDRFRLSGVDQEINYIEYVNYFINEYIKKIVETKTEEFYLPLEFEYKTEFAKDGWDRINSFELNANVKSLDSKIEIPFYEAIKYIKSMKPAIHIFRNTVSKDSYYLEYFNIFLRNAKFYPDFLLVNENSRIVFILDTKGRSSKNMDKESNNKFRSAWENIEKIEGNYKVYVYKVTIGVDGEIQFKGKEGIIYWDDFLKKLE